MSATEAPVTGDGPSSSTDNVIEVRDLHVTFAGHVGLIAGLTGKKGFEAKAVDGISLELRRGEVLALAGESGCGKTTTARTIMGLQEANAGEIVFEGKPIGKKLQAYRRRVQMVFQDPTGSLNPRQTIYEIIAEGLRIHEIHTGPNGETEEQLVGRALSRSGLRPPERFYLSYPHELSGGQRQRVVIAGALASGSGGHRRRRAGVEPGRLGPRRDPPAADAAPRGSRPLDHHRDPRPGAGVDGRRPHRGHVPRPPRRARTHRGRAPSAVASLHAGPARRGAGGGGIDRPILEGEAPDPTKIPKGCRFHPRCPVVATGRAAELGILEKCTGEDLMIEPFAPDHGVACWATKMGETPRASSVSTASDPGSSDPGSSG